MVETSTKKTLQNASPSEMGQPVDVPDVWSLVAATVLAGLYFASSVYIASHRPLWFDEVATVLSTRLPRWTDIWKASTQGGDPMPPTYFMVVRMFDNLFGHTEVALRLPSTLAVTAGLFLTFDCARRLTDGLHGLIAFLVLTCSFLPYYGHEARSYGLCFMLAALALWIWTRDTDESRLSAVFFGAALFLAVTMHYYAVLCLLPYAVWELSNWKPWRLPSRKMIAGILGVSCAAAILWAPIQAGRRFFKFGYFEAPSLALLRDTFTGFFPYGVLLLALVMVWIALVGTKDRITPLPPMLSSERIGWFFFLIPLAGYAVGKITHVLQLRYLIGTLPGIAVAFSCLLWRHFRQARRISVGVFLILATWGVAKQVTATRYPDMTYYSPIRQMVRAENALRSDGKRFFVLCNDSRYLEALHYSKHPKQYVLLAPLASQDPGEIRMRETLVQYYPMQFWTLEDLKKHARETALIVPDSGNLDALKQAGFEVETRFSKPLKVAYLK